MEGVCHQKWMKEYSTFVTHPTPTRTTLFSEEKVQAALAFLQTLDLDCLTLFHCRHFVLKMEILSGNLQLWCPFYLRVEIWLHFTAGFHHFSFIPRCLLAAQHSYDISGTANQCQLTLRNLSVCVLLAQWFGCLPCDQEVAGSNPKTGSGTFEVPSSKIPSPNSAPWVLCLTHSPGACSFTW